MKKMLSLGFLFLVVLSFIPDRLFSQVTTSPQKAKCGIDIYQGSGDVVSHGIRYNTGTTSYTFTVGRTSSVKERAVVQWDIPDDLIPDGSTVTSVTLTFYYSKISDDNQPYLLLFNVGVDLESSPSLNELWTKTDPVNAPSIGRTDGFTKEYSNSIVGTFTSGSDFARAIEASLPANKFTLGMAWWFEGAQATTGREWGIWSNPYLTITFEPKKQPLTVDQKLSNSASYGSIEVHNGNVFQSYLAPKTFTFDVNSIQYLRADTNKATVADEKFNRWNYNYDDAINHRTIQIKDGMNSLIANFAQIGNATIKNFLEGSVSAGNIEFRDPWLRDDNSDPKGLRNRGSEAIWHSYTSPFVQDINSTKFKGVLLNQTVRTENSNFYSVKAQDVKDIYLPQTGRSHRFIFQNWTTTNATITSPANLEAGFYNSPVVFTAGNSEVMANYKGTQLSNTQSAFSNSGQRKFIMTPQAGHQYGGDLHLVYESMGKIWYERSTDGGATWALGNEGKPINNDYVYDKGTGQTTGTGNYTMAKHPSLDYCGSKVFVVFQEQLGSNYLIRLAALENGAKMNPANDIPFTSSGQYSEDVYPAIAIKDEGQAVVAIRRNDASLKGLEVHYLLLYPATGMSKQRASGWITGTNENTGSFTLATARNSTDMYHIAWQQNATSSSSIQYTKFNFPYSSGGMYAVSPSSSQASDGALLLPPPEGEWSLNLIETVNVSSPTGYTRSYSPSMIGASDGTARIAFKGFRLYYGGSGTYSVSLCNPDNLSWIPYLRKYYGEVFSPQINQGSETYFVGWTELSNGSYRTIATDASTLRNMETVEGSLGRDIQINNGGTRVQQFSMGFNSESTTLPYTFRRSNSIGDIQVNKKAPALSGRGVFLTQGENQIYFILGNITSEGMMINFIESRDSVSLDGSLKKVNQYMTTEPFSIKENSFVTFAVNYGFRDSLSSKRLLKGGDAASFRVEMIDDASGRVIGTYLEVKMDKENVFNFREGIFKISSDGVGNRLVRLRVSVAENMKSHYTVSEMFLGGGIPLSKSLKEMEMGLTGSMEVREYSLSQNYPNPFNPATIINYALPRASKVTLKVYDILGKEVATLVNGYLEMGKYSVEFNASNLPSGTYIYEIRANDFVKSGKMMLLK